MKLSLKTIRRMTDNYIARWPESRDAMEAHYRVEVERRTDGKRRRDLERAAGRFLAGGGKP